MYTSVAFKLIAIICMKLLNYDNNYDSKIEAHVEK